MPDEKGEFSVILVKVGERRASVFVALRIQIGAGGFDDGVEFGFLPGEGMATRVGVEGGMPWPRMSSSQLHPAFG